VAVRQPLDEHKLQEEWQWARDRIELRMHADGLRVPSFIDHAYLEPLEILIVKAWNLLGSPEVFAACLFLIEQMHDDPAAAALAYEELKVALGLGGDYWLPIEVAARQLNYLQTSPVWQALERRGSAMSEGAVGGEAAESDVKT